MPVLCSADVHEAFFRLRVSPASTCLSLFLKDFNYKTKQLTAMATEHSRLVTIQALVSIMGLCQSPALLSLSLQGLTQYIKDPILRYFLKYLRYLDDLQTGVDAKKIMELQREVNLEDPDLNVKCQDYDCCKYEADLCPPPEDVLGEITPQDKKRCSRHLLYEFVNEAIDVYTKSLLEGGEPELHLLVRLPPPPQFQIWEPDKNGLPRRWHKRWAKTGPDKTSTSHEQEDEAILRMADSAEHPSDTAKQTCQGATLHGYFWNLENDSLSTGKNRKINLYPGRRGL